MNKVDPRAAARAMREKFGTADMNLVDQHVRGEILSDGRGEGSLQKREAG